MRKAIFVLIPAFAIAMIATLARLGLALIHKRRDIRIAILVLIPAFAIAMIATGVIGMTGAWPVTSPNPTPTAKITVSISPAAQTVASGQFTVNINVDPAVAIAGMQFDLSFDSSVITANSVEEGNLLGLSGCATYFNEGTIDNVTGTVSDVYGTVLGQGCNVSDPGVFATISFTATDVEGVSSLYLSDVIVSDMEGQAVAVVLNDGSVTVW